MFTVALVFFVCALAVQCVANAAVMLSSRRIVKYAAIGWALVAADAVGAFAVWHWAYP